MAPAACQHEKPGLLELFEEGYHFGAELEPGEGNNADL